ncbi:MAG: mannose-phosphate guanylyltransferase [Clostridium butyricum]|nr:mannose-phosphate guanylyltransferase [Clostridium butyricum]
MYDSLNVIEDNFESDDVEDILYNKYSKLESVLIDYGIMEKAKRLWMELSHIVNVFER